MSRHAYAVWATGQPRATARATARGTGQGGETGGMGGAKPRARGPRPPTGGRRNRRPGATHTRTPTAGGRTEGQEKARPGTPAARACVRGAPGSLTRQSIRVCLPGYVFPRHSRHCVPGEGGYVGLTGNERGTSEEIGKELRSSRVQDGSQNGGNYQSNRILKDSMKSHGSATMRALASLVFDTIYFDINRAASLLYSQ
jgi:hypothetical protein